MDKGYCKHGTAIAYIPCQMCINETEGSKSASVTGSEARQQKRSYENEDILRGTERVSGVVCQTVPLAPI